MSDGAGGWIILGAVFFVIGLDLFARTVGTAILKGIVFSILVLVATPIWFLATFEAHAYYFSIFYVLAILSTIFAFVTASQRSKAKKAKKNQPPA